MSSGLHGVCVDAMNPMNAPRPIQLLTLGARFVRIAPRHNETFHAYAVTLASSGIQMAFVLDSDAFPDQEYGKWAAWYVQNYRPPLVIIGNEPDSILTPEENEASWEMDVPTYRALWQECASAIQQAQTDSQLCIAGQMHWSTEYVRELGPLPGAAMIDAHLYLMENDPANARRAAMVIRGYREATGLPVAVLEWTTPDEQVIDVARTLRREAAASAWFTYGGVAGHELVQDDGQPYPTFHALTAGLMPAEYAGLP